MLAVFEALAGTLALVALVGTLELALLVGRLELAAWDETAAVPAGLFELAALVAWGSADGACAACLLHDRRERAKTAGTCNGNGNFMLEHLG